MRDQSRGCFRVVLVVHKVMLVRFRKDFQLTRIRKPRRCQQKSVADSGGCFRFLKRLLRQHAGSFEKCDVIHDRQVAVILGETQSQMIGPDGY